MFHSRGKNNKINRLNERCLQIILSDKNPLLLNYWNMITLPQFIKACVRYFSLFLKEHGVSWLFRTKYFEKKFNLQLFYLPIVSRTFILS